MLSYEDAKKAWAAHRLGIPGHHIVKVEFDLGSCKEYTTFDSWDVPQVDVIVKYKPGRQTLTKHDTIDQYAFDQLLQELFEAGRQPGDRMPKKEGSS